MPQTVLGKTKDEGNIYLLIGSSVTAMREMITRSEPLALEMSIIWRNLVPGQGF